MATVQDGERRTHPLPLRAAAGDAATAAIADAVVAGLDGNVESVGLFFLQRSFLERMDKAVVPLVFDENHWTFKPCTTKYDRTEGSVVNGAHERHQELVSCDDFHTV